jgi:nitrite reductase (NADH) small subunit
MKFHKVATREDIPRGGCKSVRLPATDGAPERRLGLFDVEGELYAIDNGCMHQGAPLTQGDLTGCVVSCPWHGWEYDVRTGACLTSPEAWVDRYPLRLEGNDILVADTPEKT